MLRRIKISNLAILPELGVTFTEGLNVLTGETGAGKSILVDAIGLLAGRRASAEDVRSGEEMAALEGALEFAGDSPVWGLLKEAGLPVVGGDLIVRRTISADGRSRVFVNDWQWTVSGLSQLASYWIDISSQNSQQLLLSEVSHVSLLDEFAGNRDLYERYAMAFSELREASAVLARYREERAAAERQKDFLSFQWKELNGCMLRAGELEELESLHRRLSNSERLARGVESVETLLDGDEGIGSLLGRLGNELAGIVKLDPSIRTWAEQAEELRVRTRDLADNVSRYGRELEFEPDEVERIEARFAELQQIARKYGSLEQAIAERDRVGRLLEALDDSGSGEEGLRKRWNEAAQKVKETAAALTITREKGSKKFATEVSRELKLLGMPQAKLSAELTPAESGADAIDVDGSWYAPFGKESVRLLFSPNPGEGARPLARIASGGELSRVLLGIKGIALTTGGGQDVTYLFDEIDSGIGGETAERVGIRMASLAQGRQVFCVTHLAQIACHADTHLRVQKTVRSGRTLATVDALNREGRRKELARMIGGIDITDKTLDHAGELLKRGSESAGRSLAR